MDVLIIGAGPAGFSAAITSAAYGLKVRVIDEFVKPGGRLLGQLHQEPDGTWWNGFEEAHQLAKRAGELGVKIDCGVSVHDLHQTHLGWRVFTKEEVIETPKLLLATGAAESSIPIPGWTLPGVMSIGAAQVMTNVHRVKVGNKGIVIGVNMLSVAITRELQLAGIDVTGMFLPGKSPISKQQADPKQVMNSLLRVAHLAPSPIIRFASKLMKNDWIKGVGVHGFPRSGFKLWGIPLHLRKAVSEIYGENEVEGVKIVDIEANGTPIKGSEKRVPADFVCISGGLYPLAELASVAGCPFHYVPELGGHIPIHNLQMETPLKGLYVAGNITGIESAKVAIAQGVVAGISMVQGTHRNEKEMQAKLQEAISNVQEVREKALIQFHPDINKGRQQINAISSEYGEKLELSS